MSDTTLAEAMEHAEPVEGTTTLDLTVMDLDDAVEEHAVDDGEYNLVCVNAKIGQKSPDSQRYLLTYFEVSDVPTAKLVSHFNWIPDPSFNDPRQLNRNRVNLNKTLEALGIPNDGVLDLNEMVGAECVAVLRKEDDPQYGEQNRIRYFITGA